ncbi:DUF3603 domain-containing protein [Pueribacillus theae]|uniref:DUF3603 domain-containing protein n=1 Tax=Pueribacillus theae TaxID=2171751 RepID=A0A2U1K6E0_9BACI|nr:YjbA family protein [Pueribacillus theae]PWA12729.1 DUF3603 domain-containing protein [Pueribacillus theae]
MLFLNDVWVNWFEGEENGYNVCSFHEWRKDDFIEVIDQVPVVKLERPLFLYIENELLDIPDELLEEIYNKSYVRKNSYRTQIEYCFIATDGMNVLAVNTLGYKIPIRKSRLIPRQEKAVIEMVEKEKAKKYFFEKSALNKEYHILSPSPDSMIGLTRKERQLKQLLFMALDHLYTTGNVAEIRYWLTEWQPERYIEFQLMDFDEAWNQLFHALEQGWSVKHYKICEKLIKGHSFFEKMWELEEGTQVN